MAKRRTFTPEFKAEVVLEALPVVKVRKQNCVDDITSANNSSRSGSSKLLKMWRRCLPPRINTPARRRSVLLTLNTSLGG